MMPSLLSKIMMKASSQRERLTDLVSRLNTLLQSPEPGLMTWSLMVVRLMKELVDLWNEISQ